MGLEFHSGSFTLIDLKCKFYFISIDRGGGGNGLGYKSICDPMFYANKFPIMVAIAMKYYGLRKIFLKPVMMADRSSLDGGEWMAAWRLGGWFGWQPVVLADRCVGSL